MRRYTKFFALVALLLAVVACGEDEVRVDKTNPGDVAAQLFNSITSGNVEFVKENIHFDTKVDKQVFDKYLDMAVASEDYKERTANYKADYVVVSETVDADTAHVDLKGMSALGKMTTFNVRLLKVDGKWKVDGSQAVLHRQQ
jgi:hypothetical protein